MTATWKKTFCRICQAQCAIEVKVDGTEVVEVRGDRGDPIHAGYICVKGRSIPEQHRDPARLRNSLKRSHDGLLEPISSERALDEIAAELARIIEQYGPRAVATYSGTYCAYTAGMWDIVEAFNRAIGSPSRFTCVTVDQSSRVFVLPARHGIWQGGPQAFETADVGLFVGINPLVSLYGGLTGGFPYTNPGRRFIDAKARGYRFICVDPRLSETARRADIHLQVRPGEDACLLCGLLNVIFQEGLIDKAFCLAYIDGVDALRAAVRLFSPSYVECRAGVSADKLIAAARLFGAGRRGSATAGTGTSFGPHANLTDHLVAAINSVCGRYAREGEIVGNPGIFRPFPRRAQAMSPTNSLGNGLASRFRDIHELVGGFGSGAEMPTPVAADEILAEGPEQIRALLSVGGNPIVAWPNQQKVRRALASLELFVQVDPQLCASAKLADYIIAPLLPLEREDATYFMEFCHSRPYAHYTRALVPPPDGVIEEWAIFWGLARRLGVTLQLPGGPLPNDRRLTTSEVIGLVNPNASVSVDRLRDIDGGMIFPEFETNVLPGDRNASGRLNVCPPEVESELRALLNLDAPQSSCAFTHRLISRRLRYVSNSFMRGLPMAAAHSRTNYAYVNGSDLVAIGAKSGDLIEISSSFGTIRVVCKTVSDVPSGVVSLSHGWGELPEQDGQVREIGVSVNRLIDDAAECQPYTGMARQTAIPVNIRSLASATTK